MNLYKFDLDKLTNEERENQEILQFIHHLLFEVLINEGSLVCNNCQKLYWIKNGIPNLVLADDEV